MNLRSKIDHYFKLLGKLPKASSATNGRGARMSMENAFRKMSLLMQAQTQLGCKLMFIGNGASAAISSHCASDYTKAGGFRSMCFNDGAALTCLANDFSYEDAFAKQVEYHGIEGDILVAISSSGRSVNIIKAIDAALRKNIYVITFTGFTPDNPIRGAGDINFYVPAHEYGLVEVTHHGLLHAILDLSKVGK